MPQSLPCGAVTLARAFEDMKIMYSRTGTLTRGYVLRSVFDHVPRLCALLMLCLYPTTSFLGGELAEARYCSVRLELRLRLLEEYLRSREGEVTEE